MPCHHMSFSCVCACQSATPPASALCTHSQAMRSGCCPEFSEAEARRARRRQRPPDVEILCLLSRDSGAMQGQGCTELIVKSSSIGERGDGPEEQRARWPHRGCAGHNLTRNVESVAILCRAAAMAVRGGCCLGATHAAPNSAPHSSRAPTPVRRQTTDDELLLSIHSSQPLLTAITSFLVLLV